MPLTDEHKYAILDTNTPRIAVFQQDDGTFLLVTDSPAIKVGILRPHKDGYIGEKYLAIATDCTERLDQLFGKEPWVPSGDTLPKRMSVQEAEAAGVKNRSNPEKLYEKETP